MKVIYWALVLIMVSVTSQALETKKLNFRMEQGLNGVSPIYDGLIVLAPGEKLSQVELEKLASVMSRGFLKAASEQFTVAIVVVNFYTTEQKYKTGQPIYCMKANVTSGKVFTYPLEKAIENYGAPQRTVNGRSEELRKRIFTLYMKADDKARYLSEKATTDINKQIEIANEKRNKYQNNINKKFKLTTSDMFAIIQEGTDYNWQLPEPKQWQ